MTGTLTISIEIELGWGVHDLPTDEHLSSDGSIERKYARKLLKKTEETDVPISFDIVGHLLLEECNGEHEGRYEADWYDADPGTDVEADPLMYAPDIALQVLDTDANHELCTHTFSHILCDDAPDELLDTELRRVQGLHTDIDERVSSFVPPRHKRPKNEVLRRNGIRVARYAKEKRSLTPAHRFKELTVGPHPEWEPEVKNGVLQTYCTTYPSLTARALPSGQRPTSQVFRYFPIEARTRTHMYYLKRATQRAIESGEPLHLWCHLYDLSNEYQWRLVEKYLEYLHQIPEDELEIKTMNELGQKYFTE